MVKTLKSNIIEQEEERLEKKNREGSSNTLVKGRKIYGLFLKRKKGRARGFSPG